jgi:hypothetical protein
MNRKRKTKQRRSPKVVDETDQAGLDRYMKMAFRKAVEKTGKVVAV